MHGPVRLEVRHQSSFHLTESFVLTLPCPLYPALPASSIDYCRIEDVVGHMGDTGVEV